MNSRRDVLVMLIGSTLVFSGCGGDRVLKLRPIFGRKVRTIGAAWRALHPDITREQIVDDLFPGGLPSDPTPLVLDRIRADFAAGELVMLDGWRLSKTEVRVAALVDMASPEAP